YRVGVAECRIHGGGPRRDARPAGRSRASAVDAARGERRRVGMSTAPAPTPRSRFAAVVAQQDEDVDLALAALLIAAEEYPQLLPEPYLARIDMLAERVRDRLDDETAPLVVLQEVSRVLFEEEGFRGNAEAYYDPRNSFLNDVLDRRTGVPLTLSLLYLEV